MPHQNQSGPTSHSGPCPLAEHSDPILVKSTVGGHRLLKSSGQPHLKRSRVGPGAAEMRLMRVLNDLPCSSELYSRRHSLRRSAQTFWSGLPLSPLAPGLCKLGTAYKEHGPLRVCVCMLTAKQE